VQLKEDFNRNEDDEFDVLKKLGYDSIESLENNLRKKFDLFAKVPEV